MNGWNWRYNLRGARRRRCAAVIAALSLAATAGWAVETGTSAQHPAAETRQTISLDLKGVDIIDVLKIFSQKSGLNFVAGKDVAGRVTIFAKDAELWDAFDRIMESNGLAYERRGTMVNVMTAPAYEQLYGEHFQDRREQRVIALQHAKATPLATVLNQLKSNVGRIVVDEPSNTVVVEDTPQRLRQMAALAASLDRPAVTRIYSLSYTSAEKLKEQVDPFLTPGVGAFHFDARTNKAVVTDLESVLPVIDRVIRAFDEREREVLIEAKIVRVELTENESLGVDWQQVFAGVDLRTRGNFRVLSDIVGGTATGVALKYASAPKENTQVVLEALSKFGKLNTVSNPRIAVANNREAKILVGTKEAFVTTTTTLPSASGSVINAPQVQFVDVGTKLYVTPTIARDGYVQLKIKPEVSSVSSTITDIANTRIPIVSTTEAETTVLVKSGATLIIGGLIDTRDERRRSQVPGIGSVPVLGAPFRSHESTGKKTELVVFLTPQIITAAGEPVTRFASAAQMTQEGVPAEEAEPETETIPAGYQTLIRSMLNDQLAKQLRVLSVPAGAATVVFTLARNGQLVGAPEVGDTQVTELIDAAKAAVQAVAPFPPFPEGVSVERIHFRLPVEYHSGG